MYASLSVRRDQRWSSVSGFPKSKQAFEKLLRYLPYLFEDYEVEVRHGIERLSFRAIDLKSGVDGINVEVRHARTVTGHEYARGTG